MGDPHKRNGESAEKEGDATEEWQTATGEERKEIMEVSAPKNSEEAGQGKEPEETEDKDEDLMEIEEEEDFDVFAVADVTDRGNGVPLFADFAVEDWALLSLRFELHLLVHAFRRDVNDPERLGIHDTNVAFYYNKYYRKVFNTKCFGVDTNAQLVDLVSDSVMFNPKTNVLESLLSEDGWRDGLPSSEHRRGQVRECPWSSTTPPAALPDVQSTTASGPKLRRCSWPASFCWACASRTVFERSSRKPRSGRGGRCVHTSATGCGGQHQRICGVRPAEEAVPRVQCSTSRWKGVQVSFLCLSVR